MDKITMAHGSGGIASEELMEKIFSKYFSNSILDKMEDAAAIGIENFIESEKANKSDSEKEKELVISTDSFVVTPIFFPGGDIGKLAVCGTLNDLLMMGAEPKYLTVSFILHEGLEISKLEEIVKSMAEELNKANVQVIAGDTKVVNGSAELFINTTGLGVRKIKVTGISALNCKVGDQIILSGNLGDHHGAILSQRMEIKNNIRSDCAYLAEIVETLLYEGIDVKAMRDVTRGGLATILNEFAKSSEVCINIIEEALPVSKEVKSFAAVLGLDPIYMGNEGKMIAVVSKEDSAKALKIMRKTVVGKDAEIIGEVTEGTGVNMTTNLGAKRKISPLIGEGLPRIC
ncbi:MAG: hydrogenase expression/formation protein HypE [Anaerovoracaceae bacterium]